MGISKSYFKSIIETLTPDDMPLWGIMSPQHMVEHLIYLFRMSIGEIVQEIVTPPEKFDKYQHSLYGERRMPINFKNPYLEKESLEELEFSSLQESVDAFLNYVDTYENYYSKNSHATNNHIIYGPLDKEKWDLVHVKHFDHHIRQFDLKKNIPIGYVDRWITKEGVGYIEFYHPEHNSLPGNLLDSIVSSLNAYSHIEACKLIVLQSGGNRTFCAGASFSELAAIQNEEEGLKFFSGFANVINAIRQNNKLVIGKVQGKAVGGGVGIASAVDYCFASQYASLKLSELNIGLGPFVIGPAVERKIGKAAFSQMTLNPSQFYSAEWGAQKGIYNHVLKNNEELENALKTFTRQLVSSNQEARQEIKKMLWEETESWDVLLYKRAAQSGKLVLSEKTKQILEKYKK